MRRTKSLSYERSIFRTNVSANQREGLKGGHEKGELDQGHLQIGHKLRTAHQKWRGVPLKLVELISSLK